MNTEVRFPPMDKLRDNKFKDIQTKKDIPTEDPLKEYFPENGDKESLKKFLEEALKNKGKLKEIINDPNMKSLLEKLLEEVEKVNKKAGRDYDNVAVPEKKLEIIKVKPEDL